MDFKTLLTKATDELVKRGHAERARLIRHAENLGELHSCLREYIFGSDAKVNAFLNEIRNGA